MYPLGWKDPRLMTQEELVQDYLQHCSPENAKWVQENYSEATTLPKGNN